MPTYGNQNAYVGLVIELKTIGPVPVTIGRGICGIVGTSARGPANEAVAMGNIPSLPARLYKSGDLKEGIELAMAQGCPVIYAVRVLGQGNAKASVTVDDGVTVNPTDVGTFYAASEGAWGNSVTVEIRRGAYKATDVETFTGDGTPGPYALEMWDLAESSANYVKVNGTPFTIVYDEAELATGKVYVDTNAGTILFHTDDAPEETDVISVYLKYYTRDVIVTDNESTEVYKNIKDLVFLQAALNNSVLANFIPADGATHLPAEGKYVLAGGLDGAEITTDDWERALQILGDAIAPTTVAITSYEVEPGTYDLIPVLGGFVTWMANKFKPCIGFVSAKENETLENLLDLADGYNNMLLVIEANGWDKSTPRKNLAVAHAAKEAAVSLGESTALPANSLSGVNDLLVTFNQDEMDVLTRHGINVFMKQRGIKPYVSVTTASDWQFSRCVDVRTINWVITAVDYICQQFYHHKRTPETLASIQRSIEGVLDEQVALQNIRTYKVFVYPNPLDTHRVDVELLMENIGHIERFRVVFGVGIMEE